MTPAPDQLPDDIKTLKELIIQGFTHRDQEIALLKEQLKLFQAMLFGKKSEKAQPDGQQLLLNFGAETEQTASPPATVSEEEKITVGSHSRSKRGRKPLSENLPCEEVYIDISEAEKICACGCTKAQIGSETSKQLEYTPAKFLVIKTIRLKYACRGCEGSESAGPTVSIAPVPDQIIPKSFATPSLLAYIITSKFVDSLPFYRLSKMFSRNGVDLSRGTMCNWTIKVASLLKPVVEVFKEKILGSPLINADETTYQVLKEVGKSASSKSQMWAFRGGGVENSTILFHYNRSRAGKVAENLLANYVGYVQTDGYAGYNFVDKKSGQTHLGCWAHARRKFFDAVKSAGNGAEPGLAHEAIEIIQRLYKIERNASLAKLSAEKVYEIRQAQSKPILVDFEKKLRQWQLILTPKSLTGKAVNYTLKLWKSLLVYVEDGSLPIDNNSVENAIRPIALGRKNWLFSDTVEGAEASAIIFSIVETARANDLEPYWYLRFLLEKLLELKTKEAFLPFIPQNIDKQLISDLQAKHLNLNFRP